MRTFAYLRVSTDKQTVEQQLNTINEYVRSKGITIDEMVADEGISGGVSYKQRSLSALVSEMKQGDALIVSEISRLGRCMSDLSKLVNDELKPRKLRLIVVKMGIDMDCSKLTAIDQMLIFAFGFTAEMERELIKSRTKSALDVKKRQIEEHGSFITNKGRKFKKNILTWYNIPEWAIYALEYGVDNDESLSDEDRSQITEFIESNFPHGYTFSVRWDERNEFDRFPAFGLPCVTYTVDFVRL